MSNSDGVATVIVGTIMLALLGALLWVSFMWYSFVFRWFNQIEDLPLWLFISYIAIKELGNLARSRQLDRIEKAVK